MALLPPEIQHLAVSQQLSQGSGIHPVCARNVATDHKFRLSDTRTKRPIDTKTVVGYYRGDDLIYVARVRSGFVPASRRQVFARLKPLLIPKCPFANLPETHKGRWGEGLTAADMEKCVWVRPETVARIEFLEWTDSGHLRHSKFAGLREDKAARTVIKEHGGEG